MHNKKSTLKIQSGILKGHSLKMVESHKTRSSKSILKQSLFNTLSPILSHYCFIEVFAGTGSIGLEAISKGAPMAYFIEKDPYAYSILDENINTIKTKMPNINLKTFLGDSFKILPQILQLIQKDQKIILFFDPPFPIRENFTDIYEKCFALIETIDINCLIIFEYFSSYQMPKNIKDFSIIKVKKFGKSGLIYYTNHI